MNRILTTLLVVIITTMVFAQEEKKPFKVEIHGFVGVNAYFDSRQSAAARNGNIYLWPLPPSYDDAGNDKNAESKFDIDAAYSRFNVGVSGPEVFGAKSFAFIEGDFLGDKASGPDLYFRMRHAFVRLNWTKTSLLMGQYWHPLFVTENYPSTVNLSCGVPFHPLNRQPMVRFGYQVSDQIEVIAFLMSQNDFTDWGMMGAMENSLRPETTIQAKFKNDKGVFASLTAGYKSFRPQLIDANGIITDELAQASYFAGSFRKKFKNFTFKAEGLYGGGMTNTVMLGGFAEKNNGSEQRQYTPIQTMSIWTDIHTNHKKVQPGVFAGYTQNMGTKDKANYLAEYTLGGSIRDMYTIAPRVVFYATPKIYFGAEWMYTVAAHGEKDQFDDYARPINTSDVSNHRITLSTRYIF